MNDKKVTTIQKWLVAIFRLAVGVLAAGAGIIFGMMLEALVHF